SVQRAFHHEGFIIFSSLVVFLLFPFLCRHIDVTSAPVDPGILSIVIMAVLTFLVFKSVTWIVIRIIWPVFHQYSEGDFEQDFRGLYPLHKVLIYLGFYVLLLMSMVFIMGGLL
ncbi:hypothetical protein, partial [Pararcticibacter amylolyticus]